MSNKWNDDARKYQAAAVVKENQRREQRIQAAQAQRQRVEQNHVLEIAINSAASELLEFMHAEGLEIHALLSASGRHIIFGEENEGGGLGRVYCLTANGLEVSTEPMGTWVAYGQDVPKPRLARISAREAIAAAVYHAGKKPSEVMDWLRAELDKIASEAPADIPVT